MALAMVLILIILGLFVLMCWAKASITKARLRKKQLPPTYRDVIKNPDKYPMTVSSAAVEPTGDQAEGQDIEAASTETQIEVLPGTCGLY